MQTAKGIRTMVELQEVGKLFESPTGSFAAIEGVSLSIGAGEFVAVVGRSGSGKSTLMNMITAIDRPTSGRILVGGTDITLMDEDSLARWRGKSVGVVFQFFQLLPTLSIAENVMLPMDFVSSYPKAQRRQRALELLSSVGIEEHADKFPSSLSGGQQQRAAIARALANDPDLIVADEPTGNLDSATARLVVEMLSGLARQGKTVILVSHERDISDYTDRTIVLRDGKVSEGVAVYA